MPPPPIPPPLPPSLPRKCHLYFTHTYVPMIAITSERRGLFLNGLASPTGQEVMRKAWAKSAAELGGEFVPGDTLQVHAFQHQSHLCIAFLFPPATRIGEAHCGLVIAGPVRSLAPEALNGLSVRYFVLEHAAAAATTLREWTPGGFANLGPGPADLNDFTDTVFAKLFGGATTPAAVKSKSYKIDELLALEPNAAQIQLCGALEKAGGLSRPGALNPAETTFLTAFNCWGEIQCEGLNGWLANHPHPDNLRQACAALREIGAPRRADVIGRVASLFPGSTLPVDSQAYATVVSDDRHGDFLTQLEAQLEQLEDEDMAQLLDRYVRREIASFR